VRVPLTWLRELCPTTLGAQELSESLTNHGLEVERVLHPWERLSGVLVARVLEVRDHPNADKLCLARIDVGGPEREVVVGVRNMAPGDLVPYAPPGATLPGFEHSLERRDIRGVTSEGMLCSPKELGISPDHGAILVLDGEAEPGSDLKGSLGLDDAVLDVEVNPNRPDVMSILGVAREVAAVTGEELVLPDTAVPEGAESVEGVATVEVLDGERCPRYLARVVRGVTPGASPLVVQIRLAAAGMRPLSGVVDATNYVMLELGQPLHPFDLSLLAGPGIVVRTAEPGEQMETLDGVTRTFTEEDLLICDRERPVAVAGVMGGAGSEVSGSTSDVLLESATFHPVAVLRTARRLGLRTEASVRFERGADPEAPGPAAARAAALIAAWSGGTVLAGEIDVGSVPARDTVALRPSRARLVLGMDLSEVEVRESMGRLRLTVVEEGEDRVVVEVPGYRADLSIEADLIEEVGRMRGYAHVPSTLPGVKQAGGLSEGQRSRRRIRDVLAGAGAWEATLYSFAPASDLHLFGDRRRDGIRMANPVSEEEGYLRTSLLPGLLRAARRNVSQRRTSLRLFEAGRTFVAEEGEPREVERVAAVLHGTAAEEWPGERRELDFLDAKGLLEHLMAALGIEGWSLAPFAFEPFHPGRSAEVAVPGEPPIGELAELHPSVAERFELPGRVAVFELQTAPLVAAASSAVAYRPLYRFPPVRRDLSFLVDRDVEAGAVRAGLIQAAGELLDRVMLVDVFEGDPLPTGKKSLAFSVDLRAADRTLTDQEANDRVELIARHLRAEVGAELRAG
jgi:phenylalanyl-tRNA synthetase beta chain